MAGKQGNQQYNNGECQVPWSISEYLGDLDSNSRTEVDSEMSSGTDYRAVFGVGGYTEYQRDGMYSQPWGGDIPSERLELESVP